jgi:hypothetical protein
MNTLITEENAATTSEIRLALVGGEYGNASDKPAHAAKAWFRRAMVLIKQVPFSEM